MNYFGKNYYLVHDASLKFNTDHSMKTKRPILQITVSRTLYETVWFSMYPWVLLSCYHLLSILWIIIPGAQAYDKGIDVRVTQSMSKYL